MLSKQIFRRAVLASSLLCLMDVSFADIAINDEADVPRQTSIDGNITLNAGKTAKITTVSANPIIRVDSANSLTVSAGSVFSAENDAKFEAIRIEGNSSGSSISNSGVIRTLSTTGPIKIALNLASDFFKIENNAGASITGNADNAANAISINAADGALSGEIYNLTDGVTPGEISSKGSAILISKTYDGLINNLGKIFTNAGGTGHGIEINASVNKGIVNDKAGANAGFISSAANSGILVGNTGNVSITNKGTIQSDVTSNAPAIKITGATSTTNISNAAGGIIQSLQADIAPAIEYAPTTSTTSTFNNNGQILGAKEGIKVTSGKFIGSITNDSIITGGAVGAPAVGGPGISILAEVTGGLTNTNSGVITGNKDSGVIVKAKANVTNAGTITGPLLAANKGGVEIGAGAVGKLVNNGTISYEVNGGASGAVIVTGAATYDIENNNVLTGRNGLSVLAGAPLTGKFINNGTINTTNPAAGAGIFVSNSVSGGITNNGSIKSLAAGIVINGLQSNIINNGLIEGEAGQGISLQNTGVSNIVNNPSGIIRTKAASVSAIQLAPPANSVMSVSNFGIIEANSTDAAGIGIFRIINGSLINSGTITALKGIGVFVGSNVGSGFVGGFSNSGTVTGASGIFINIAGVNLNITNQASGVIESVSNTGAAINIGNTFTSSILNKGIVRNNVSGPAILVNNVITGNITNDVTGTIRVPDGNNAIEVNANITAGVFNLGTIDAGASGFAFKGATTKSADFTNSGTLIGKVQVGTGTFTLNPGSVFNSAVSGVDGANSKFVINLGSGTTYAPSSGLDGLGEITVQSGTFVQNQPISNGAIINLLGSSNLEFNNTITLGGAASLTNQGSGQIVVSKSVTLGGKLAQTGTGKLSFRVFDANNYGQININNTYNLAANTQLEVTVGDGYFPNGQVFTLIKGATAGSVDNSALVLPTSALVSFTKSLNGNDIQITAARRSLNALSDASTSQVASILDSIAASNPSDALLKKLFGELSNLATPNMVKQALFSLSDEVNGSRQNTILSTHAQLGKIVSDRLNLVRAQDGNVHASLSSTQKAGLNQSNTQTLYNSNSSQFGYAAGDMSSHSLGEGKTAWVQGFANRVNQKMRKSVPGYESRARGVAAGYDMHICPELILGVDAGHMRADVDGLNQTRHETRIKSYLLGMYASLQNESEYVDAQMTFGSSQYETVRNIVIGTLNQKALGNFSGFQFDTRLAYGVLKSWQGWRLTPELFTQYAAISTRGYNESGAGALSLRVAKENRNVLELGSIVKFNHPIQTQHGLFVPGFEIGFSWDAYKDRISSTTSFMGGGSSFVTKGPKPAVSSLLLGAGFVMQTLRNGDVQAKIDLVKKNTYNSAEFAVTYRIKF